MLSKLTINFISQCSSEVTPKVNRKPVAKRLFEKIASCSDDEAEILINDIIDMKWRDVYHFSDYSEDQSRMFLLYLQIELLMKIYR